MKQRMIRIAGILLALVAIAAQFMTASDPAAAQTNLLTNGSLETPYYGQGAANRTVPSGWNIWVGEGAPIAFPHSDSTQVRDGSVSWNLNQGYAPFTAAGYQQVSGFTAGEVVKATAYAWVFTCNDTGTSCIISEAPYRKSDTSAGASVKVGIDPTGGTNPNSGKVVWSGAAAPYDQWAELTASATMEGGTATVFLYMTQTGGLALNNVYWDAASLVRTGDTGTVAPSSATATPAYVPFVTAQGVRADGSIVHTVQAGDTLSSIAVAYAEYGVTNQTIAELNGINANARFLQIGQELVILSPGSVDPQTGQLLPQTAAITPAAQPTAAPTEEAAPTQEAPGTEVADAGTEPEASPEAGDDTAGEPAPIGEPVEVTGSDISYEIKEVNYFPFERGVMLTIQGMNTIYVLIQGEDVASGTYKTYMDTWNETMPETDETILPPPNFSQPERGFGQAWRTYEGLRDDLGWGTGGTTSYTGLVVHEGDAFIVNGPDNRVYALDGVSAWTMYDFFATTAVTE